MDYDVQEDLESKEPHLISQLKLLYLVRDLDLPKEKS